MTAENTFADRVVRESFRPHTLMVKGSGFDASAIRREIVEARRFVLDDAMSEFLAEISHAPFSAARERNPDMLDSLRHGARLPYPLMWVEFNGKAFRRRLLQIKEQNGNIWRTAIDGQPLAPADESPPLWGWLLKQHPQIDSAVHIVEFVELDENYRMPGMILVMPFAWVYQTTDDPLPWAGADLFEGIIGHGIMGYKCPQIGVVRYQNTGRDRPVDIDMFGTKFTTTQLLVETAGVVRYVMALLATLNDIPSTTDHVRPSKGYVARGRYRKFMEHSVVKLNVPQAKMRTIAHRLIVAARRKAHQVRGHWRVYARGEGVLCEPSMHLWSAADLERRAHCTRLECPARRKWIDAHQRGDASLGWVTHSYAVTHDVQA